MDPKKAVNWSIPRASLSSNSSTSSKSYNSSDSIRNYHRGSEVFEIDDSGKTREQTKRTHRRFSDGLYSGHFSQSSLSSNGSYYSERDRIVNDRRNSRRSSSSGDIVLPKRGSRSSQGSTDSNHSASSLLLTVKNLENFAKIQENQQKLPVSSFSSSLHHNKSHHQFRSLPCETLMEHPKECSSVPYENPSNNSTLVSQSVDVNRQISLTKTKDIDQQSVASSTHFTIVNGFGTPRRFKDTSLCRRSRQITILIVTMTILFMIAICVTVFLMEMRARKMPRYHQ